MDSTVAPAGTPAAASMIRPASRSPVSWIDAERDDPPGARRIERAHQRGRVGIDDPVVHSRAVPDVRPQAGRPEDHPEVRPERVLADVRGTDAVPDGAARAVASDQVGARDDGALAGPGGDRDPDLVAVLLDVHHRGPGRQRARGQLVHHLPQEFLQDVLRCLLAELGEPVAVVHQAQDPGEPRQFPPGERGAEHDVLRPRGAQRRPRAQPVGDSPPAQMLHRPHVDRLAARPRVGHGRCAAQRPGTGRPGGPARSRRPARPDRRPPR